MGITEALKSSKLGDVALPVTETPAMETPVMETPAPETPVMALAPAMETTKLYQLASSVDRAQLIRVAQEAGLTDASRVGLEALARNYALSLARNALASDSSSLTDNPDEYTALFVDAYTRAFLSRRGQ